MTRVGIVGGGIGGLAAALGRAQLAEAKVSACATRT